MTYEIEFKVTGLDEQSYNSIIELLKTIKQAEIISSQNNGKQLVSDSKKMRCTKTLIHSSGSEDFTADEEYDIIEKIPGGVVLRNNHNNRHTVLDDGWLAFFYYC